LAGDKSRGVWTDGHALAHLLEAVSESQRMESGIMNTRKPTVTYCFMIILTLVVGLIGIPLLFLPDFDLLSIVLSCAVLGGLIGGWDGYEQRDRQRLQRGYKVAFEWLILVLLAALAFIASAQWFGFVEGTVQ